MTEKVEIRSSHAHVNGIRMHLIEAGPPEGPLVVLLHGFPEFWYAWRAQIEALAAKGYHVVAPDQRGYNLSDKPESAAAYGIDTLSDDIIALIDHFNRPKAFVAGHDWGACVAWWLGSRNPERIEKLAIVNVPHPVVMRKHLRSSFTQLKKSWYMFFFQLPWLPETMLEADRFALGTRSLQKTSRPGTFSADDLERYREAWRQPGAMTGMINWYRALARVQPEKLANIRVTVPTLIIWGKLDKFLGPELAGLSLEVCDRGRVEMIEDATHWVLHEEPQRTSEMLAEFFSTT